MANSEHFKRPFDEGTKAKLEIFKNYLIEWLPVFISSKDNNYWDSIFIYDFFSGAGKDISGNNGSPLIILEVLNHFESLVNSTGVKINVVLNEMDLETFDLLSENVAKCKYNRAKINVNLCNKPFKELFIELYPGMLKTTKFPKLMILDQFGIKEISENIFKKLIGFERTDFIFFISSSFVRRFSESPEFSTYIKINKEEFSVAKPFHAHRVIFNYYKSLTNNTYKLAPFSIKKGVNVYGLIFGSKHTLGLEKFLKVGWNINPHTGDANFNIDEEKIILGQLSLFDGDNTIKKIGLLHKKLARNIFDKKESLVYNLYVETLEFGCQPKHCNEYLRKIEKEGKIKIESKLISEKIHTLANSNSNKIIVV